MITDATRLAAGPSHGRHGYDVCIIGAGPAGICLAVELDGCGVRVCLLEAGGERYHRASQRLYEGEVQGDGYPPLRDTRLGALGGSTNVWAGWCRPLDEADFAGCSGPGSCGWPIALTDLLPYYRRAHERCGLGVFEYAPAFWQARLGHSPLVEDDGLLEHAMFHLHPQRFGERYRTRLEASDNILLVLEAPVTRLVTAPDGSIDRLSIHTLDGTSTDVTAHRYVLAAGGIENARMLLMSSDSAERAPGNAHGLVGRYFTDHAFVNVGALILEDRPRTMDFYFPQPVAPLVRPPDRTRSEQPAVRAALTLPRKTIEAEGLQGFAVFLHPRYEAHPVFSTAEVRSFLELYDKLRDKAVPGAGWPHLRRALRAPHRIALAAARKLVVRDAPAARWRVRAMFETESRYDNRVTLGKVADALGRPRARVQWRVSDRDLACMPRAIRLLGRRLGLAAAARFELAVPESTQAWRRMVEPGKHQMGATRMHPDPKYGVVDPDGRVHGCPNLYVTGASVFPNGGYANPTLTVVALAVRLADHLMGVTASEPEPPRSEPM